MVWEEWDTVQRVLDTPLADCPETANAIRIAPLTHLLLLHIERGNWEGADQVHQTAQQYRALPVHDTVTVMLTMHHTASLARCGRLNNATATFKRVIERSIEEVPYTHWLTLHAHGMDA